MTRGVRRYQYRDGCEERPEWQPLHERACAIPSPDKIVRQRGRGRKSSRNKKISYKRQHYGEGTPMFLLNQKTWRAAVSVGACGSSYPRGPRNLGGIT